MYFKILIIFLLSKTEQDPSNIHIIKISKAKVLSITSITIHLDSMSHVLKCDITLTNNLINQIYIYISSGVPFI